MDTIYDQITPRHVLLILALIEEAKDVGWKFYIGDDNGQYAFVVEQDEEMYKFDDFKQVRTFLYTKGL